MPPLNSNEQVTSLPSSPLSPVFSPFRVSSFSSRSPLSLLLFFKIPTVSLSHGFGWSHVNYYHCATVQTRKFLKYVSTTFVSQALSLSLSLSLSLTHTHTHSHTHPPSHTHTHTHTPAHTHKDSILGSCSVPQCVAVCCVCVAVFY